METADQPTEEMSERHDHSRNYIGKVRIELCAKSFILQVYDVLARHRCSGFAHAAKGKAKGDDRSYENMSPVHGVLAIDQAMLKERFSRI
jgi:hypothetical protein